MSRSKGRSSFYEARCSCTAQLIYLMICVGLPYVPHGGLSPCEGTDHHCIYSFDVWGVPASPPKPCDRLYHCEKRYNVRMQLSQTVMPVFWYDAWRVLHGCRYSESVILVVDIYGMFGVFHYAKILPRCIGCYISGSDLDDALFEAELFMKRVLI